MSNETNKTLSYKEFVTELKCLEDWHDILVEQEGITNPVTLHHKGLVQKLKAANYNHSMQYVKDTKEINYVGN